MEFTIHYDEATLRRAVSTFMMRRIGHGIGWLGVVAVITFVVSLATLIWQGNRSWVVGVSCGTLLLLVFFILAIWIWRWGEMRAKLAAIPDGKGVVSIDEDAITIVVPSATTAFPWASFTEVWKLKDCWLLFLAPNNFVTLPTTGVPTKALDFIARHLPPEKSDE